MNIQEIVTQLKALDGKLPYEALRAAITRREQIIPELLQLIKQAKENPQYILEAQNYLGHVYAIYLLAQFREKLAYPLIIEFFSIAPDIIPDITKSVIDKLGCILASVYNGDDRLMKNLLENEQANEYVRSEAIIGLVTLVAHEQKSREEIVTYFQSLFRDKLKRTNATEVLWSSLVFHTNDLYPEELYEDIQQTFTDELVDPFFGSIEEVEKQLTFNKKQVLKQLPQKYPLVDEAITEIEKCAYFSSMEKTKIADLMLELTSATGIFPRKALEKIIKLQEETTPHLLDFIRYAEQCPQEILEQEDFMAHIYALFLLAQFREHRAYPLIVKFFSVPGEISVDITGDVVTENLHRILASVYDGNDSLLRNLVENNAVNDYVRGAALRTFLVLVVSGQKSREEVMTYFQNLFRGKLKRAFSQIWNNLVSCSVDLYPEEVYTDIQQAYTDHLVEPFYIGLSEVEKVYACGREKTLKGLQNDPYYTLINNAVEEMQDWAYVSPLCSSLTTPSQVIEQPITKPEEPKKKEPKKKEPPPLRISKPRKGPKIGRNQPCPCGSGKKYKKCCRI